MSFGLLVGHYPWDKYKLMTDVGEVSYNTISGAVANLVVDGIGAGTVVNNSMSNPQGTRAKPCSPSYSTNYAIGAYGNATLQSGWVFYPFANSCQ
jgi:hypothetical protein